MPYSTTHANNILDWTFGKKQLPAFTKVYIGLCSNDPEETYKQTGVETFNELSGGGYARVLISQLNSEYPGLMNGASGRAITNGRQINWTKATANWARAKGFGLFTAEAGGAPYFYGKLKLTAEEEAAGGLLVEAGSVALFDPQTLKIEFPTTDTEAEASV